MSVGLERPSEASSMEILEFDVVGLQIMGADGVVHSEVDEVGSSPDGIAVYVDGEVSHNSPPRSLNEKMFEHGYAYVDWAVNGKIGDNRALFTYTQM